MHDGYHSHDHDHVNTTPHTHPVGHNAHLAQWQTPHLPEGEGSHNSQLQDLDLVEQAFIDGFNQCADPTSFVRLARIPFVGLDAGKNKLHLLRVEVQNAADMASVTPLLGERGVRYDPLPATFVARRSKLQFIYHDGRQLIPLGFNDARLLTDITEPTSFNIAKSSSK